MEDIPGTASHCPKCHTEVRVTDYYCYNCGSAIQVKPPSTSTIDQVLLYIGSVCLPPMGIIWGIKYVRQPDTKSKSIGIVAMILTVLIIFITINVTVSLMRSISSQVNSQMQIIEGF
jgi:hypothetical protein